MDRATGAARTIGAATRVSASGSPWDRSGVPCIGERLAALADPAVGGVPGGGATIDGRASRGVLTTGSTGGAGTLGRIGAIAASGALGGAVTGGTPAAGSAAVGKLGGSEFDALSASSSVSVSPPSSGANSVAASGRMVCGGLTSRAASLPR
jgi:hypothetical protein